MKFGNDICDKCKGVHPYSFDCEAEHKKEAEEFARTIAAVAGPKQEASTPSAAAIKAAQNLGMRIAIYWPSAFSTREEYDLDIYNIAQTLDAYAANRFAKGAAAMREQAAQACRGQKYHSDFHLSHENAGDLMAGKIAALPLPEENGK